MDADQFKQLVMPHYRRMYMLALRLTADSDDAQDVVQDSVTRLWQSRSKLDDVDNIEAYISAIVKNAALDTVKRRSRSVNLDEVNQMPHDADVATDLARREQVRHVMNAINDLPDTQQQVLMMRDVYGYEFDEIERATGCNYGHIRVLLSRARKTIKNHFIDTTI